jgi:aspartyl-tRNA(Asn)/glutamyl-tRNA(Gln) amidotransferase subunit A
MKPYCHDRRSFLAAGISAAVGLALQPALGASQDLADLTLKKASELLRSKAASSVDLTQACLERIETHDSTLNAFITVTREQALTAARRMDAEQRRGHWRGPLHGIPIALKDNIDTAGLRTTAASELFKNRVPSEDAEVVRRLKIAGAILLGKTNLHEFAYGGSSSVSYFGPVHNPWALDRVPGGSSGGSAAATASGLCFGSLGTDTAGSVRIPASYCGIVGFKPTYGRVSNRGVIPLSWTLDHVGPLCKTVEDAALFLGVVAGFDELDPTTVNVPVPDYGRALKMPVAKLRLGVPRAPFFDNLDPEISKAVDAAIEVLRTLTASLREVQLPPARNGRVITGPEAYAYHSQWLTDSPEKYQPATRDRLVQFASAVTTQDYVQARRQCDLLRREIKNVFTMVDLLVTPTMASPPSAIVPIEQSAGLDPSRTRNTWPFDVSGLPAITVPCGFTSSGLPIGLQIVGAPFAEPTVLAMAHAYEQATGWHSRHPVVLDRSSRPV